MRSSYLFSSLLFSSLLFSSLLFSSLLFSSLPVCLSVCLSVSVSLFSFIILFLFFHEYFSAESSLHRHTLVELSAGILPPHPPVYVHPSQSSLNTRFYSTSFFTNIFCDIIDGCKLANTCYILLIRSLQTSLIIK